MPHPRRTNLATRLAYAELLRHFLAGRMTTDEYEDATFKLERELGVDDAVAAIFDACWHLYDDLKPHRMTGRHKLGPELHRRAARWILFLRGGSEYAGHEVAPDDPIFARTRRANQLGVAFGLSLLTMAGAIVMAASSGNNWSLLAFASGAVSAILITVTRSAGVCVNPGAFVRAFRDEPDPWPFANAEELNRAVAAPTYLHG